MKKNIILKAFITLVALTPTLAFAEFDGIKAFLSAFTGLINPVITIIIGLSLIYFFWGMSKFILHAGEEKTHKDGKNMMIWSVIALFVMFSIWGILNWIGGALDIQVGSSVTVPLP